MIKKINLDLTCKICTYIENKEQLGPVKELLEIMSLDTILGFGGKCTNCRLTISPDTLTSSHPQIKQTRNNSSN